MISTRPLISVIIPTRNRAVLLEQSLGSLARQSLSSDAFEIVVIDDGSTDDTYAACDRVAIDTLHYLRLASQSGIAAAKNLGVFVARAPLLLFFDDDDVAHPDLLAKHLETHTRFPEVNMAVLGFTDWAPSLARSALMEYVTGQGGFLFSYGGFGDQQVLDYQAFWGGRTSCKREMLTAHGIFNQDFVWGCEDMELGYRLSTFGLRVLHARSAISFMNRSLTYEEFCARCERQGRAQALFNTLHDDAAVRRYCQIDEAHEMWPLLRFELPAQVERVKELEGNGGGTANAAGPEMKELFDLYRSTFNAFKYKGILEALDALG